jgi:glutamyl-tRNA synthetase/glutamyl-Q tRNA(Asp) synthetase
VTLVTRFAPSPTGYLHLGHVAAAIHVWGLAARAGACVLLRIEDHDRGRCRPEYEAALLADLDWLGLAAANRAELTAGARSAFRQSDERPLYEAAVARLAAAGLVYACDCSRKRLKALASDAATAPQAGNAPAADDAADDAFELRYDGHCRERGLPLDAPGTGLRVRMLPGEVVFRDGARGLQRQDVARQCGDVLVRDRDGNFTYQLCVALDDHRQGVDLVIRGDDLLASTARQIRLAALFGRATPPAFYHHALVRDADGRKLGKRFLSEAIAKRRAAGEAPEAVLGEAAHAVGLAPTPTPLAARELGALFADVPLAALAGKGATGELP